MKEIKRYIITDIDNKEILCSNKSYDVEKAVASKVSFYITSDICLSPSYIKSTKEIMYVTDYKAVVDNKDDELNIVKGQNIALKNQIETMQKRIEELLRVELELAEAETFCEEKDRESHDYYIDNKKLLEKVKTLETTLKKFYDNRYEADKLGILAGRLKGEL